MKLKFGKPSKKLVIIASIVVLVCAIGCGVWYYLGHSSSDPVFVYPFHFIGMTEYWGDSQESYGPVTTDKIQTIFLSDTQTVTEICVKEGDEVKKGDLLMTFDTTLSDLALERKRLEVEKLRLDLDEAKKELRRIKGLKPMEVVEYDPPSYDFPPIPEPGPGTEIKADYEVRHYAGRNGSSESKAVVCWIRNGVPVNDIVLNYVLAEVQKVQVPSSASEASDDETPVDPDEGTDEGDTGDNTTDGEGGGSDVETPPVVSKFYVIFKSTAGNMSNGDTIVWQGMCVEMSAEGVLSFQFFDASGIDDYTKPKMPTFEVPDIPEMPDVDMGSGLTAQQIAQMRSEQEKLIKDMDYKIKMANADYKIMQTEVSDGKIYSDIDGKVISLLTEEDAKKQKQPIMKVSGGGGFSVEGAVNELDKENLKIGQEVTISDWRNGMTYTGTVQSIGDFPNLNDSWMGAGNPNASYYPFHVFVDSSADLQAGSYVSVTYSAGESKNGVYLSNPFVRTEKGRSYVYLQGENGKLEQRFVTTGKALWGSYTEILDGITAEDLLAFPYGKNIKPGLPVQEGDLNDLYG